MKPRLPLRSLVVAIAIALGTARADTGITAAPGNALNPAGVNPATAGKWMFEEGMGTRSPAARTPSGQLYDIPVDPGEEEQGKEDRWKAAGFIELGGIGVSGDERSQGFRNYKDLKDGLYLNSFWVGAEKPAAARFVELAGGGVGMDDAFYRFQAGRYNDWRITAFYDATPQVSTTTYRSLWSGVGERHLTLNGLRPGGTTNANTTQANILDALAATPESELQVVRRKAGARVDVKLSERWKAYAAFASQKREGAQPLGAVFGGGGGGGNVEVAEPVDDDTHEVVGGVQFSDPLSSFNLRAAASFYRNNIDTFTFQNPLFISLNGSSGLNATTFTQGRFDSAPGNEHFNLKGEYARVLPSFFRGTFTAVAALGTMRQDDNLLAPTELALTGGTVTAGGVPLVNAWNTPSALTRQSADARIDTALVDLGLVVKPGTAVDLKGKVRYYETRNGSEYLSCNPLTGQWGRILNEGSGLSIVGANTGAGVNPPGTSPNAFNAAACDLAAARALGLVPATGNVPIASIPNEYSQLLASLAGDWRVGRAASLNAAIEREVFRRDHRERDETTEDKVRLGFVDRGTLEGTVRLSFEHARREGSEYNHSAYQLFQSASLGPTPTANGANMATWLHGIGQLRSFDLADRRQNVANGRIDYALNPNVDGAVSFQVKDAEYLAPYGRTGRQRADSVTLDLNYQAGPAAVVYGFFSRQSGRMEQKGIHSVGCQIGYTYYFYSDGRSLSAPSSAAPPATPAGTTLVGTQAVAASNWSDVCGTASPTSPLFPESRAWAVDSKDRNDVIGAGIRYDFGRARLDASASRSLGRTRIDYAYNAAALGLTAAQAGLAGSGLADMTFAQTFIDASLQVPINRTLSLRLLLRYETGKVRDWHYEGLGANPMPTNNAAYLDAGPQDYDATTFGLFFQVRL